MKLHGVLGVCVLMACSKKAPAEEKKAPPAPEVDVATAPAVEVVSGQLFVDYVQNQIAADQRYTDKVVQVRGMVKRVGKSALGEPMVVIDLAADANGMLATFSSDTGLAELKKWDEITVRCVAENFFGKPRLRRCLLVATRP